MRFSGCASEGRFPFHPPHLLTSPSVLLPSQHIMSNFALPCDPHHDGARVTPLNPQELRAKKKPCPFKFPHSGILPKWWDVNSLDMKKNHICGHHLLMNPTLLFSGSLFILLKKILLLFLIMCMWNKVEGALECSGPENQKMALLEEGLLVSPGRPASLCPK